MQLPLLNGIIMSDQYRYCPLCKSTLETVTIDNVARLKCIHPGCSFVHWNNPVPVVAAIVEQSGKIILARNRAWPREWYALIAGFLERDETPDQAIIREVKEELGLNGTVREFIGYYSFFERNQLILAYHVEVEPGDITLCEELDDYKQVHPEDLVPWEIGTGPAVKDWLSKRNLLKGV